MSDRPSLLALALFVAGLLMSGLVVFALLWSGPGPYRDLARANGVDRILFVMPLPLDPPTNSHIQIGADLEGAVAIHEKWSRYVTGAAADPPTFDPQLFTQDEYGHMADVRSVFATARFLVPVGLFLVIVRLQRARAGSPRVMWRLLRDGSLIAAVTVAAVGITAVFAFEPLFLAFHYVFFPQGNFLFDPATSNLIRLYPDWYWEGISLRVGLSFIAVALGLAAVAQARLRSAK
ncbi:MAG: DUF1461 domain-containing protein [Chloroflexota bacterium]|nr:DUF1461 domain-containing protein [Chloroflexota bacterium]